MNKITRNLKIVKYQEAGIITKNLYFVFTLEKTFHKTSNEKSQKDY